MSDNADARSTWTSLLHDLQHNFPAQDPIPDESTFHTAFNDLCVDFHERDPQRLLARFLRQHDQIIAFIGAVDDSLEYADDESSLSSCFWTIAYSTLEAALSRGSTRKRRLFEKYIPALNNEIPAFGSQLGEFPHDPRVQQPLQTAFQLYIRCYLVMREQFASQSAPIAFEVFVSSAEQVTEFFGQAKTQWEDIVVQAKEEQAQRLAVSHASQPSFPYGSLGPLGPQSTRATFDWLETLGRGTYGQVSKVKESSTGTIYAQKVIQVPDPRLMSRIERQVQNEVEIMQRLRHHHIASVQFYVREPDSFSLVMLPVADYDLQAYLQNNCINDGFPTTELTRLTSWFGCLVSALTFAHSRRVKHEDIKPRNILIRDYQPYLADFGCAQDFSELETSASTDVLVFGTPVYWAPESPPRGRSADVFSLGCVFSEMLTVRQCRTLDDYRDFRWRRNRDNAYAFRENLPKVYEWIDGLREANDRAGDELAEQTLTMLQSDPQLRPDAKHVTRLLPDAVFCTTCR